MYFSLKYSRFIFKLHNKKNKLFYNLGSEFNKVRMEIVETKF